MEISCTFHLVLYPPPSFSSPVGMNLRFRVLGLGQAPGAPLGRILPEDVYLIGASLRDLPQWVWVSNGGIVSCMASSLLTVET